MFTQDDWLNRVNAPYLDAARKREAGFLPSNFADQFEEIPERGFWDSFASGAKAQGAGVLQGQAEFVNALGIGNGDFANTMNQVMQENARRREFTWQDMVNDPMKYIADPEGLMYDLGGAFGSTGVLLGETALTGGVGGAAARAMGLAGKIGGTARMIAAIDKVAKANNMPWVHNILVSPAGKMLALNIMKTPFEAVSEGGNVRREIRETGGTEEEQLSGMLSSTALNAVLLTFTNSLESAGLGKLIAKEGGKDALVKKLTGVTQTAAKEASKPNFVQKMNLLNKVDFATVGKTAVGLTANALQNAYEEGAQETIGQYAKGEKDSIVDIVNPFAWSDEALTGAVIGGVTGAAQGAVMTGVGKGLNKAFGFEEKKPQELKVTTPAKQENVSGEAQQNLEPQEQPQAQVQEQVHPQVQAQVQGYEEAFGVDEESVKAFEEKQRQQLSQAVANGVDEEVLQAKENRKNQLLDILGIDIPQFTGAKKQEQPKVAPQSPIKPKAWNQTQKGGYIGRYSDESIKKALNKSDAQLKEFALKIQKLNDKDQMKIAVYNELKKRGIDMGKGFMMEEPEAQLEVYKPKFSDIPAEKLANAAQWYADKPQQFEQDYQNAISRLQRLAVNNDAAKELLQNLQQFRETVMSYQKIQQENKPLLALQQGIPEEVLQAVEENPEEAALIFEEDAERFVAENINAIEDVNERKKQARLEKETAHEYLRSLLKPALDILNAGRNKGYSLVPGNQDNGRKVRMSNNDLWYQEFRKEKQHKPLVEEMEELAYLLSIDKFPYSMPYEFAEILNTEEYQEALPELKQQLDYARAYYFALKEAYDKTLEESKQAVKAKGEKNEKSESEPKRTETSESKDDGNAAPQPSEEKKTDGEVEEYQTSAIGSLIKKERQRLQTGNYPTITQNKSGNKITYSTNEYGTKTEKVGRGKGIPQYQSALSVENTNLNRNTPTPSKQALKKINADNKKARATKSNLHNKLTDIIYHDKYANLAEKQQARTLLDFMLSVYSREQQESLTYEELQKAYEKYEYNTYIFGGKHFKQGTKEESDVVARNRKSAGEQQVEETKAQIKLEIDELIPELLEDYNNVDFNEVLAEINRRYGYPNSFNSLFTYDELANVIKDHLAKRNSNLANAFEKYYEKLKANDEIWQLNFVRKPTPKQAESTPQQEKKAEGKETPAKEEKVAENRDFPAKIGNYELVPLQKGSPSNMRDYQNPSNPNSDFYNVLVDNQTGVVYVTGSGMTEDEELGFPSMQDAVNFIRDGEAYKGLSAKEVKSKQAMVKRMENGEVAKPAKKEIPKVPKATQAVIDYVKEQTNLDLTPYLDNTFKAKRGQMNIRITSMSKVQLDALKMFVYKTSQGHGSYQIEIEDLGNWGITLKFKKQDSSNPVKYSAAELDKKFQAAYHGSPHIFNEFSLEHIGTGEGAQVHGWGLYFTQSEKVAQSYRERLSHIDPDEAPKNVIINGIKYRNIDGTWENATTGEYYDIDSYQDIAFNAVANEEGDVKSALKNLKKDTYYNKAPPKVV